MVEFGVGLGPSVGSIEPVSIGVVRVKLDFDRVISDRIGVDWFTSHWIGLKQCSFAGIDSGVRVGPRLVSTGFVSDSFGLESVGVLRIGPGSSGLVLIGSVWFTKFGSDRFGLI